MPCAHAAWEPDGSQKRGMRRGGYWTGRVFGWQRAWEKKARNGDLGGLRAGWRLGLCSRPSYLLVRGALRAAPGWGRGDLLQTPPCVCSEGEARCRGRACSPGTSPCRAGSPGQRQEGAGLGVGARGESKAEAPGCVGRGVPRPSGTSRRLDSSWGFFFPSPLPQKLCFFFALMLRRDVETFLAVC